MTNNKRGIIFILSCLIFFAWFGSTQAGDFALSPAKVEIFLSPGGSVVKNLYITNRLGYQADFNIEVVDVEGSKSGDQPAILLEDETGIYSLKNYLKPQVDSFMVSDGQTFLLPIEITLPEAMSPGGLYGAVLISALPLSASSTAPQINLESQLGALFFVKVAGKAEQAGQLNSFKKITESFSILFENQGNVHLNPYGLIIIEDIFGRNLESIEVDPFYALPDSLRERTIPEQADLFGGRYTATLFLNRGYNDIIETARISFWIFSWQLFGLIISLLILILILILWRVRR